MFLSPSIDSLSVGNSTWPLHRGTTLPSLLVHESRWGWPYPPTLEVQETVCGPRWTNMSLLGKSCWEQVQMINSDSTAVGECQPRASGRYRTEEALLGMQPIQKKAEPNKERARPRPNTAAPQIQPCLQRPTVRTPIYMSHFIPRAASSQHELYFCHLWQQQILTHRTIPWHHSVSELHGALEANHLAVLCTSQVFNNGTSTNEWMICSSL